MAIHDSWARYYDKAYELTFGEVYTRFTNNTLDQITSIAKRGGKILDMGAGTGRLSIPLAKKGYQVTAVEISKKMCDVLAEKAKKEGVKVQIVNRDMTADLGAEIEKGTYDFVICVFTTLNYLTTKGQLDGFLNNSGHALYKGGLGLISFVEDMKPMQNRYNGRPQEGRDRKTGDWIKRDIMIEDQKAIGLYNYDERGDGEIEGKGIIPYHDRFPLRAWGKKEILEGNDVSAKFPGTGETYLLIEKNINGSFIRRRVMPRPLFKPAGPAELANRKAAWIQEWDKNLKTFKSRKDVFERAGGGFDIRGDMDDWGSKDFKHLALKYGSVIGNFSCGGVLESLKGAPKLICGNFNFHGDLRSLKGFPKEIWGSVEFTNHPAFENEGKAKRWTTSDIKKVCEIRGTIKVENHSGL